MRLIIDRYILQRTMGMVLVCGRRITNASLRYAICRWHVAQFSMSCILKFITFTLEIKRHLWSASHPETVLRRSPYAILSQRNSSQKRDKDYICRKIKRYWAAKSSPLLLIFLI